MSPGQTGLVPGTKWVCPRDKPRFSSYFTQRKPSLSLGQTQFVPGTFRGRRAADRVYVLKVYVPVLFPRKSETGRIRFRGVRFQTPNSVSFFRLTEFAPRNSVSSSQPIICVCKSELTEFLAELTEFAAELSEFSLPKQYSRNSIPPVP